MQGVVVPEGARGVYSRTFEAPADWSGHGIRLRFDAVHSSARVYVNGMPVGFHEGAFEVFEFDITEAIRAGKNDLDVHVQSGTLSDQLAFASLYASHDLGGITRKVTLYPVPHIHLAAAYPYPRRRADGDWEIVLTGEMAGGDARCCAHVSGPGIPTCTHSFEKSVGAFEEVWPVTGVHAWDPEHPCLYELTLVINDEVRYVWRIGFRAITVCGSELLINDSPVKLRGINRHEVHPLRGRAACAPWARSDAELFRAAHINFIRTCHYPPPEEFLDACDELGLLVECEAALCWVGDVNRVVWKGRDATAPDYREPIIRANASNVLAHRHHPSVLFWSLGNESAWSDHFDAAQAEVKRLDPTRPTIFHNIREHGGADLMNCHYPLHFHKTSASALLQDRNKPLLVGEDVHIQTYNRREVATDPGVREEWGRCLAQAWEDLYHAKHVVGLAIWSGIDDVFVMPDGRGVGYGPWGIIDGWRREKPEYWHVKKIYAPVRISYLDADRFRVVNRLDFTDVSELTFRWRVGEARVSFPGPAIPPRSEGVLSVPALRAFQQNLEVLLHVQDARGVILAEERFDVNPAGKSDLRVALNSQTGQDGACPSRLPAFPFIGTVPEVMILPLEGRSQTENDFSREAPVFNDTLKRGRVRMKEDHEAGGHCDVVWDEAEGNIRWTREPDGGMRYTATLALKQDVTPRQMGLVFTLPSAFNRLRWSRKAEWTCYPDNHIGRPEGETQAQGVDTRWGVEPAAPWSADHHSMGCNDFRATRTRIKYLDVMAADGRAIRFNGRGEQAVRAWLEGDTVKVLVAEYSTGGDDSFLREYYESERRHLKAGDRVVLTAHIHRV